MPQSTAIESVSAAIALATQLLKQMEKPNKACLKSIVTGLEVELAKLKIEVTKLVEDNEALRSRLTTATDHCD